ncbi:transcription factor BHLH3-like [Triticum urartu]|uniref:transcription factor BHLH3-like n=1 Tax=Triticum urartu TaxID=4572 RepID=UPI0020432BA1|nr:transcription factor BHLH3-like [Triticum urartu]
MDQLEESFLDECRIGPLEFLNMFCIFKKIDLVDLTRGRILCKSSPRQEDAPSPQEANPGGSMMLSDLLFYASESAAEARRGPMDVAPFRVQLAPMPTAAPLHRPHEEFNFDCLSKVCNPYRSCVGGRVPAGVVHATGMALAQYPLHHAMAERETSGGKLHCGGGSSSSPDD